MFKKEYNTCLILEGNFYFKGVGIGKQGMTTGEICFNTAMTGYQEVLSDPSYDGQIVTFSFPHIGNVGVNKEDMESEKTFIKGIVIQGPVTNPSNYRSQKHFNDWLIDNNIVGISQIDTRSLIKIIRDNGPLKALIYHSNQPITEEDIVRLRQKLMHAKGIENESLSLSISTKQTYNLNSNLDCQYHNLKIVVLDFGVKKNILKTLNNLGCNIVVMPALSSFEDIIKLKPDGIVLSNGPGDPNPVATHTTPIIKNILKHKIPLLGICLGHQLMGLALGGTIKKMSTGHHGINHPIKSIETGKIEITSQNHEFILEESSLPKNCIKTHFSLFDRTLQGIQISDAPAFSVQFHPEASPGPHDSHWLFEKFVNMVKKYAKKK